MSLLYIVNVFVMRNKSGEGRLNELTLLNVHRYIKVNCDDILNMTAKTSREQIYFCDYCFILYL